MTGRKQTFCFSNLTPRRQNEKEKAQREKYAL
jgi:hypothetical protein